MKIVERHFLLSLFVPVVGSLTALGGANVIANSAQQAGGRR